MFYVAITRAEKHCILTCAKSRWRYGKMEFSNPSRFLKDIDPNFIHIEREAFGNEGFSQGRFGGDRFSEGRFGGDRFGSDRFGGESFGRNFGQGRFGMQNSRPVASQFMADKKPKITSPRRSEPSVDPFSEDFKRKLAAAGGNFRRIRDVSSPKSSFSSSSPSSTASGSLSSTPSNSPNLSASSASACPLKIGNVIEHQRFGIGKVVMIEGAGENTKATVDFQHVGTKQLLLKFARYTIIK